EDIAELVEPIALRAGLRPHVAHGGPEAQGSVTDRDYWCAHTSAFQVTEHRLPTLGALARAVLDGDQLLRPVGPRADHHERAEAVVVQPDVEMHAIDPDVHVVAIGEAAFLEGPVLGLP